MLWGTIADTEVLTSLSSMRMVRHMPHRPSDIGAHSDRQRLAGIFHALADQTRLAVVERLSIGPASTTELARPFGMALPSFIQHLGVLERAGIVRSQKSGRVRAYQLVPDALGPATSWLATSRSHWQRRLDQLDELVLATGSSTPTPTPPSPTRSPASTSTQEQPT